METTKFTLNNNQIIPAIGIGSFDGFSHSQEQLELFSQSIYTALNLGYRLIDCADAYGNEESIGDGLHKFLEENKESVQRSDIFITSKVFVYDLHDRERLRAAVQRSLKRLRVSYLDLYIIHFPVSLVKDENGKETPTGFPMTETWKFMEELVDEGLVKSIGVSNFGTKLLKEILQGCRIKPVLNQVECNPLFNQSKLLKFCQENQIILEAYSPLGKANSKYAKKSDLLNHPGLLKLAEKYKVTPAQIALKWQIQRGVVIIPKSITPERIKSNIMIGDLSLSKEDMEEINTYHTGYRMVTPPWMVFEED